MALQIDTSTYRSPNYNSRLGNPIRAILLHTTEGNWPSDAQWLSSSASQVSAHYVISPQAMVFQLVDDSHRAWHAGTGSYAGISDWNTPSIGIEVSHREHSAWAPGQRDVLRELCLVLIARYGINRDLIAAHRWIAPDRRRDPTDFPDSELRPWIVALYGPPVWDGPPGTYPVDPRLQGYYDRSGGLWSADRFCLGYALSPLVNGIQRFERGRVRLKADGTIQALLLSEIV